MLGPFYALLAEFTAALLRFKLVNAGLALILLGVFVNIGGSELVSFISVGRSIN